MDRQLTLPLTQLYNERSLFFFTRPQFESQSQKYSSDWSIGNFLGSPYQKRRSLCYKRMPYLVDQLLSSSTSTKVIITTNNRKETTENIFLYFRQIDSKYHRILVFVPNEFRERDLNSIFNDQWKNMIEQPRNYPLTSFTQENDSSIMVVTPKETLDFIHNPEEHLFECEPKVVFIPDVNRFPQSQLLMLIPIIRLLQWADPEMEVIFTAAPLANLDSIRIAFFEEPQTCKILQKEEFRGILTTRVHKMEKLTLNPLLNSLYRFIYEEIDLYLEDNQYLSKKGLFFFPKNPLLLEF